MAHAGAPSRPGPPRLCRPHSRPQTQTEGLGVSFWSLRSAICRVTKLPPLSSRVEPNCEVSDPYYIPASALQSGPWVRGESSLPRPKQPKDRHLHTQTGASREHMGHSMSSGQSLVCTASSAGDGKSIHCLGLGVSI